MSTHSKALVSRLFHTRLFTLSRRSAPCVRSFRWIHSSHRQENAPGFRLRTKMERELARLQEEQLDMPKPKRLLIRIPPKLDKNEEFAESDQAEFELIKEVLHQMEFEHLPHRKEWKTKLPSKKQYQSLHRYFLSNKSTIQDLIATLGLDDPERNGEKVTIIEGYPGPGTISSELLKSPQVEKLIALESSPDFLKCLLELQKVAQAQGEGHRFDILPSSVYMWETYNMLIQEGKLSHLQNRVPQSDGKFVDFCDDVLIPPDHADASWQKLSPVLFLAQLPNTVYGEQLFAQIVSAIATRSWLFRHGRIKLAFVCGEAIARRCIAQSGDNINRGKLGTTVQCLADVEMHKLSDDLRPHEHHFFPSTMSLGPRVPLAGTAIIPNSNSSKGRTRTGMVMMTVTPKVKPLISGSDMEAFEYVLRNLFILRSKPVGEALTHLAPGGQNILNKMSEQQVAEGLITREEMVLPEQHVHKLTNVQWACLARTFDKWPFRPQNLFEETPSVIDKR